MNLISAIRLVSVSSLFFASAVKAADAPLHEGTYFSPRASYSHATNDVELDYGIGGVVSVGYRNGTYAFELGALYSSVSTSASDASLVGGLISGLWFPFRSLPGLYATAGVTGLEIQDYPTVPDTSFSALAVSGGLGYIVPFQIGTYEFGVRAEALFRHAHREARRSSSGVDLDAAKNFDDALLNIGLQLPLGIKSDPPLPSPAAVVVTEVPADSDGDGVADSIDKCPETIRTRTTDVHGCELQQPQAISPD